MLESDFENRLTDVEYTGEDSEIEYSLRPQGFDEYVGQEKVKNNLKIYNCFEKSSFLKQPRQSFSSWIGLLRATKARFSEFQHNCISRVRIQNLWLSYDNFAPIDLCAHW